MCQEALADCTAERELMELQENRSLFIACAWITSKEQRMFC